MARGIDTSRHEGRKVHFGAWANRINQLNATVPGGQMGDRMDDDPADYRTRTTPEDVHLTPSRTAVQPVKTRIDDMVTPQHVKDAMREDEIRGLMEGGTSTAY